MTQYQDNNPDVPAAANSTDDLDPARHRSGGIASPRRPRTSMVLAATAVVIAAISGHGMYLGYQATHATKPVAQKQPAPKPAAATKVSADLPATNAVMAAPTVSPDASSSEDASAASTTQAAAPLASSTPAQPSTSEPVKPAVQPKGVSVAVFNASKISGAAEESLSALKDAGYTIATSGDLARWPRRTSALYFSPGFESQAAELAAELGPINAPKPQPKTLPAQADLTLVLVAPVAGR